MELRFWTTLIEARAVTHHALEVLQANCTHVAGDYWIMEGDVDCLRDQGVRLREVAEGAVGALGGLSEQELRQVCLDSYGVRVPDGGEPADGGTQR
jgi:hypothetical protein